MFGRLPRILSPLKSHLLNVEGSILSKSSPHYLNSILPNTLKTTRIFSSQVPHPNIFEGQDYLISEEEELAITRETIKKVNEQVKSGNEGRLFAVVHICGKQFKITTEDIIIVEGYWAPQNGDEINLEKVLMIGGQDFTLVGRPILPQSIASVRATVIEKDLSHTKTIFYKRRRKQYQRINWWYRPGEELSRVVTSQMLDIIPWRSKE